MESFGDIFTGMLKVWGEMLGAFLAVLPKVLKFLLWALSAMVILPCVFVAGSIYPVWAKWGEDF